MADFIIKSATGTGNKTLIQGQDQSGSAYAVQVNDAGATTLTNATITAGTFPTGAVVKHEQVLTAISSDQILTTSYVDITGSSITYTPATGASYIVYECSFVMCADSDNENPLFAFKFMIDGTITKSQDSYAPYMWGNNDLWSGPRLGHKMMYSASGWTSDKVVKMQARDYGGSNNAQLFSSFYDYLTADGSTLGGTDRKTDVITTIYSVM